MNSFRCLSECHWGTYEGGIDISISGKGFDENLKLYFDSNEAINTNVINSNLITATLPEGGADFVDVVIIQNESEVRCEHCFKYTRPFLVNRVTPNNGSIAGNTLITIIGQGFSETTKVKFGDNFSEQIEIIDSSTILLRTPIGNEGFADIIFYEQIVHNNNASLNEITKIENGYLYFQPKNIRGGVTGGPINGTVNVTVLNSKTYAPVENALVIYGINVNSNNLKGYTNSLGQITISAPEVVPGRSITAVPEADYASTTIGRVLASDITLYVIPFPEEITLGPGGEGPQEYGPSTISGTVIFEYEMKIPRNLEPPEEGIERKVCAKVATSRVNLDSIQPAAGEDSLVFLEDPGYKINSRTGEMALYAIAGICEGNTELGYKLIIPGGMGIRHFVYVLPGNSLENQSIIIDTPLDHNLTVELQYSPTFPHEDDDDIFFAAEAPNTNQVELLIDIGPEGIIAPSRELYSKPEQSNLEPDQFYSSFVKSSTIESSFNFDKLPTLSGRISDANNATFNLVVIAGRSQSEEPVYLTLYHPMSTTIKKDIEGTQSEVVIDHLLDIPKLINPERYGYARGNDIIFSVEAGPIPSCHHLYIYDPQNDANVIWWAILPSNQTVFTMPELDLLGLQVLPEDQLLYLQVSSKYIPLFNFSNFTLHSTTNTKKWESWTEDFISFEYIP